MKNMDREQILKQLQAMGVVYGSSGNDLVMDLSPKPQHTKKDQIILNGGRVDCHVWIVVYENGKKRTHDYSKDTMARHNSIKLSFYYEEDGERNKLVKKQFPKALQEELKPHLTRVYEDFKKKCEDALQHSKHKIGFIMLDDIAMYSMENCYQHWNDTFGNCVYRAMRYYEVHKDEFAKRKAQGEDCYIDIAVGSLGFLLKDGRVFWEFG